MQRPIVVVVTRWLLLLDLLHDLIRLSLESHILFLVLLFHRLSGVWEWCSFWLSLHFWFGGLDWRGWVICFAVVPSTC